MAFKPGQSGNPNGRPKGTDRRAFFNSIIKDKRETLLRKAISMAEQGNTDMMKFLCGRMIPAKVRDDPIPDLDLDGTITEQSTSIMDALRDERIDPTQAKTLMDIINTHKENLDSAGYEPIVNMLKAKGIWEE